MQTLEPETICRLSGVKVTESTCLFLLEPREQKIPIRRERNIAYEVREIVVAVAIETRD